MVTVDEMLGTTCTTYLERRYISLEKLSSYTTLSKTHKDTTSDTQMMSNGRHSVRETHTLQQGLYFTLSFLAHLYEITGSAVVPTKVSALVAVDIGIWQHYRTLH